MEFGSHLNFRDPDNIALEINSHNDITLAWLAEFKDKDVSQREIETRVNQYLSSLTGGDGPA